MRMENPSPSWQWKIYPPRAMSSSVHLRSGLVWTRHLNTAPGDFTEVLYLESAFGAPTRTLRIKNKGHSVTTQYQASAANAEPSPSRECVVWMLSGRRSPALCGAEGGGAGGGEAEGRASYCEPVMILTCLEKIWVCLGTHTTKGFLSRMGRIPPNQ